MNLSHIVVAGAALVSFSVIAADETKQQPQAQSGQSQPAQSGAKQQSAQSDDIKKAQEKLSAAGHDAGPADGKLGPQTQRALKEFQQSKGLDASGQLDQKTLAALGASGDSSASTGSSAEKPSGSSAEKSSGASAGASSAPAAPAGSSSERTAEPKPQGAGPAIGAQPSEKPKY
jgi:peptidoglycan hydrolase-like protein with peptidoglycan-binding domain